MWRLLVVPYYRLLLEKSSLAKHVEFINSYQLLSEKSILVEHVVFIIVWFHTLRRGGCQAPCLSVFPLVTALPAIGLRASWVIARG